MKNINSEKKPLVSVVIPCYNQGHFLSEAVESVLGSTYENIEVVVVNDGSTNLDSIEILEKFSMPKTKIIHQENKGLAEARNTAIRNANGKYILPLDADDKIAPKFIAKAVEVLESKANIGIVGGKTYLFGSQNGIWDLPEYKYPDILKCNCLICSHVFRKQDWETVGGYNPNMIYSLEDYDFWLSLIEIGREVHQFDEVTFYYRKYEESMISSVSHKKLSEMSVQLIKNHVDLYLKNRFELISVLVYLEKVEAIEKLNEMPLSN